MVRRLFGLGSLLLILGIAASSVPTYAVYQDTVGAQPAQSNPGLQAISAGSSKLTPIAENDDGPGLYVVQLAEPPLTRYDGGIAGLAGTSAAATGSARVDANSPAARAYLRYLDGRQRSVLTAVERIVGGPVTPAHSYRYTINGFAARFTPAQAAAIAALPGVRRVDRDQLVSLQTDRGPTFIGAAQDDLQPAVFQASLSGDQEVPPVTTTASGSAVVTYDADSNEISFSVSYEGLSGAPTLAHIHIGDPGVSGGVVLDIFDTAVGTPGTAGAFIGTKTIVDVGAPVNQTAAEIEAALLDGGLYFNIHTAANPNGEIRGQITPSRGEGVIVGILDSGINIDNPSFADVGDDGYNHTNPLGSGNYLGVCDPENATYNPDFPCNDKVIGAYTFDTTDGYPDPQGDPSPADNDGHGSHTASTAAGNVVNSTSINGVSTGAITGVAPHANIIVYDVCGIDELPLTPGNSLLCSLATVAAAVDQATIDGVDVFNRSIGSAALSPWTFFDALSALGAFAAGIVPVGSAGNSGPSAASLDGDVASAPWTISVAASTHDRVFINNLQNFAGGSATTRPSAALIGKGFSLGITSTSIVYAGDVGNALCGPFTGAQATQVAGKIVACDRGTYGRVEKAENVQAAGGVGYVLMNNAASGNSLSGDVYPIPGVHISYDDGVDLKAWLTGCSDCTAAISGAIRDIDPAYGDVMASFSSRGPNSLVPDVLKPDVSGPGVDILAVGIDANGAPGQADYAFLSGTSMSSPHVAGAAALLRQIHPDWTPAEIKSALMSTGVTTVLKEDGATPTDPFDVGGGRIDVAAAARAGLVFDVTTEEMLAADPETGGSPNSLNLASVAEDACIVTCTFVRTVRSTLGASAEWTATVASAPDMTLTVEPASFTLAPGATQTISITADVETAALDAGYLFGQVTLSSTIASVPAAGIPVAIQPAASDLPDRITITARAEEGSDSTTIRSIAVSDLTPQLFGLIRTTPVEGSLAEDPTPNDLLDSTEGISITQVTIPAGSTRYHVRTRDSTAPDLDLYVFLDGLVTPDGIPQEDELICVSATSLAEESCDIFSTTGPISSALPLLVLIQNYGGSGAATDTFRVFSGIVGNSAAGNLTLTAPETNPAGNSFDLTFSYDLTGAEEEDLYIGWMRLSSSPTANGDLGLALIDVVFDPYSLFVPMTRR